MTPGTANKRARDFFLSLGVAFAVAAINYALVLVIMLQKQDEPGLRPQRTAAQWVVIYAPSLFALLNSLFLGITGSKSAWLKGLFVAVALYVLTIGYAIIL